MFGCAPIPLSVELLRLRRPMLYQASSLRFRLPDNRDKPVDVNNRWDLFATSKARGENDRRRS